MVEKFSHEKIVELSQYDFLQKETGIYDFSDIKTKLVFGKHAEDMPFVTVYIPTYHRPELLRKSIESVLNQKMFSSYEILVIDNAGIMPGGVFTETEKMIRELNHPKVVYYQNESTLYGGWNRGIIKAKSPWVCMLHDDDVLNEYHLYFMHEILYSNPQIDYLGCKLHAFSGEYTEKGNYPNTEDLAIFKIRYQDFPFGGWVPLLGAFFRRECAIDFGGFDWKIKHNIGDFVFTLKFAYYHNMYQCSLDTYGYRVSDFQATANEVAEINSRIVDYYVALNVAQHKKGIERLVWSKLCKYEIVQKISGINKSGQYGYSLQVSDFYKSCNLLPCDFNGVEYKVLNLYKRMYFCIYFRIFRMLHKGKIPRFEHGLDTRGLE